MNLKTNNIINFEFCAARSQKLWGLCECWSWLATKVRSVLRRESQDVRRLVCSRSCTTARYNTRIAITNQSHDTDRFRSGDCDRCAWRCGSTCASTTRRHRRTVWPLVCRYLHWHQVTICDLRFWVWLHFVILCCLDLVRSMCRHEHAYRNNSALVKRIFDFFCLTLFTFM